MPRRTRRARLTTRHTPTVKRVHPGENSSYFADSANGPTPSPTHLSHYYDHRHLPTPSACTSEGTLKDTYSWNTYTEGHPLMKGNWSHTFQ